MTLHASPGDCYKHANNASSLSQSSLPFSTPYPVPAPRVVPPTTEDYTFSPSPHILLEYPTGYLTQFLIVRIQSCVYHMAPHSIRPEIPQAVEPTTPDKRARHRPRRRCASSVLGMEMLGQCGEDRKNRSSAGRIPPLISPQNARRNCNTASFPSAEFYTDGTIPHTRGRRI